MVRRSCHFRSNGELIRDLKASHKKRIAVASRKSKGSVEAKVEDGCASAT